MMTPALFDEDKKIAMHKVFTEEYRLLLDGAAGLNGATIIALDAATVNSGELEREILNRGPILENCATQIYRRENSRKLKPSTRLL